MKKSCTDHICTYLNGAREELCNVHHYTDHITKTPAQIPWYGPKEYGHIRDGVVIACVDVVFVRGKKILLGKRCIDPAKGYWWVIGGKMNPGESPAQAAARKTKEETGLKLPPKRFHFIGLYSTVFALRNEPPKTHGAHTMNLTYMVELTEKESKKIALDPKEYAAMKWCALNDVLEDKKKHRWHPALRSVLENLQSIEEVLLRT